MEADGEQIEQEKKRIQIHTHRHALYLQRITMNATRQFFSSFLCGKKEKKERKKK